MPTIEVNYNDLQKLVGTHIPLDVLQDEGILFAKGEIDEIDGEVLKIDIKDTNRPDLWSAEGIARELQGRYAGITGVPKYSMKSSGLVVKVDRKLKNIRPLTVCAVVRGLNMTPDVISQMIQLQEKVSITYGKNRKEVAIGVYDYKKITSPISFTSVKPDGIKFVPLEFDKKLTPAEILKKHPKGMEYAHLLGGLKEYPIFIDAKGEVLSLPPIINSDFTGKVTHATKDVFIECSGFDFRFLIPALNVIVTALADRGGDIETVEVKYGNETKKTPELQPKKHTLDIKNCNEILGLGLSAKDMCKLLEKARYDAKVRGKKIEVHSPGYRQDIMHERDIIEDIIISYGFNKVKPVAPELPAVGGISDIEKFSDAIVEVLVGLGMQEVLSYILTNKNNLFRRMNFDDPNVVEIENVMSSNWSVFRKWMLPSLLEFLSKNKHREYPQNVFEVGDVVFMDKSEETKTKDIRKVAAALCDNRVGYEQIASIFDSLSESVGVKCEFVKAIHPTFIPGRVAEIKCDDEVLGVIGEIHPKVLNNWGIENPVSAFELNLDKLFALCEKK